MENITNPEQNREEIKKEKVIEMLQANGLEHPETKKMMLDWTRQQEASILKENMNGKDNNRANIIFDIERSDLYIAAGDMGGVLDLLDSARQRALQGDEKDLYDQIMKKMDEVEG